MSDTVAAVLVISAFGVAVAALAAFVTIALLRR